MSLLHAAGGGLKGSLPAPVVAQAQVGMAPARNGVRERNDKRRYAVYISPFGGNPSGREPV